MHREFMTREEVMSQLRLHGITDLADVEQVVLEPNGMISVVRRDHGEPDEPHPPADLP
nr:YetF domain-containing protein [Cellulomonas flavigena]